MKLISKEVVRRIIDSGRTRKQMLGMVECAVTFELELSTESSTDSSTDCISREAAISAAKHIFKSNSEMKAFCMMKMLEELPPVKPKNYFEEVAKDIDIMEEDIDLARDALVEDDDCISREAVIEILSNYGCTNKEGLLFRDIKELPAVRPKERTGHWIAVYQGDEIINYRCSECEFGNTFGKNTDGMHYCPRCGTRMTESR